MAFDMFSAARRVAAQYREIFEALVEIGFSETQAMTILTALIGSPVGQAE
ncbi:hypothetical protein [Streptomyces collinus]